MESISPEEEQKINSIVERVISCLEPKKLSLLDSVDSQENPWSFEQQLRERCRGCRPVMASEQEMKEHIENKIHQYQVLIGEDTADAVREILLDELDEELFISKGTYLGNLEMKDGSEKPNPGMIVWAVDRIMEVIDPEKEGCFYVLEGDKKHDLRSLMLARWNRAWISRSRKNFLEHLRFVHTHSPYSPLHWPKGEISHINLQAFLGKMDPIFLYPRKGRRLKWGLGRNDEGFVIGGRNDLRGIRRLPPNISSGGIVLCLMWGFYIAIILLAGALIIKECLYP